MKIKIKRKPEPKQEEPDIDAILKRSETGNIVEDDRELFKAGDGKYHAEIVYTLAIRNPHGQLVQIGHRLERGEVMLPRDIMGKLYERYPDAVGDKDRLERFCSELSKWEETNKGRKRSK